MNTNSVAITAHDLSFLDRISRPSRRILDGITLQVHTGEMVAIMGPSGAGKTTLLYALSGMEAPDSGEVVVGGVNPYSLTERQRCRWRREKVGFLFQGFNLLPEFSAAENVALPLWLRGGRWGRFGRRQEKLGINKRVFALMEGLGLKGLQGHGPEEISGGEQQRLALARAMATAPPVLLADEPTGNLDWRTGHEVVDLLVGLCKDGVQTVLMATHDARAAAAADRVLVMQDGKLVEEIECGGTLGERGQAEREQLISRLNTWEL